MTAHEIRPLAEDEFADSYRLFLNTLHQPPVSEERWQRSSARYEWGRVFGAFCEGELAGTAISMPGSLMVPGGEPVAAAAVTGVGVRPDRTRRGLLTGLMRAQLADVGERGEPVAMLHASEAMIYPRFGYGMASRSRTVSLRRGQAAFRADAPGTGSVRLVDTETAEKLLPEVYRRIASERPGTITRSDAWWSTLISALPPGAGIAVHTDTAGLDDGFALYTAEMRDYRFDDGECVLKVSDLQAADVSGTAQLWRFLLEMDLVTQVMAAGRPIDESLEWWLTDRRVCRVTDVPDDLWVRLVDVSAALNARVFNDADPVVIEVRDAFLPENSGTYRIGPEGVWRCVEEPQLSLDVDVLGALYLGDVALSALVASNRIDVHDPAAVEAADRLFATTEPPWCGTGF